MSKLSITLIAIAIVAILTWIAWDDPGFIDVRTTSGAILSAQWANLMTLF